MYTLYYTMYIVHSIIHMYYGYHYTIYSFRHVKIEILVYFYNFEFNKKLQIIRKKLKANVKEGYVMGMYNLIFSIFVDLFISVDIS